MDTEHKKAPGWDNDETAALVEYVALGHTVVEGKDWPTTHTEAFWAPCAEFVANKTGKAQRTFGACRSHVNRLKAKHITLHKAEEYYNITYTDPGQKENRPAATTTSKSPAASLANIKSEFHNLTTSQQWDCVDNLFRQKLETIKPSLCSFVPRDFIKQTAAALNTLHTNKRENTLFHLASALGTPRENGSGPRMPVDRMPFPLIEYNAKFFHVDHPDLLRCSSEYTTYMESMYAHFGRKWASLHCGPMWRGGTEEEEEEEEGETETAEKRHLLQLASCKEVDLLAEAMKELGDSLGVEPLPVEDQLPAETNSTTQGYSFLFCSASQADRMDLQEGLSAEALQRIHNIHPAEQRKSRERLKTMKVSLLSQAHSSNPDGCWWIKADACDLKQGLRESMRHEWSGDTDLGDGKLQQAQEEYKEKQAFVRNIGAGDRGSKTQLSADLTCLRAMLEEHTDLLQDGLTKSEGLYTKRQRENASEETLFALGWEIDSFRTLTRIKGELSSTMREMLATLARGVYPTGLRKLCEQLK
ncbi:Hypp7969 [Branchiostoma lanceolatum]|uniref:Hypp7969 protein n=1 Tax=Branchiostoma lanceolatum TaxID=7740 RepID=A0A8J9Z5W2_BRALA|nr:Hypp7969 [Branchiostoma lanceolatum]